MKDISTKHLAIPLVGKEKIYDILYVIRLIKFYFLINHFYLLLTLYNRIYNPTRSAHIMNIPRVFLNYKIF